MCELDGFRLRELGERGNLLAMLQCLGLLSHRGTVEGLPRFATPNQTARHLMHGILRDAYDEAGALSVDIDNCTNLARTGAVGKNE